MIGPRVLTTETRSEREDSQRGAAASTIPGLGQALRGRARRLLGGMCGRAGRAGRVAAVACLLALPSAAAAHVVYAPTTLRDWVRTASLIAVVEIVRPLSVWRAADGSDLQEYISVRVVDVVEGEAPGDSFDFIPHSEGEPRYRGGERALLFLESTGSRAELSKLSARFPYYSRQGAGTEWKLAGNDDPAVEMARAWSALPEDAPVGTVRSLLLRQLVSGDAALRGDAILALVRFRLQTGAWPDAESVAPFARLATDASFDVPTRVALLRVLDGAPGFDAAAVLLPLTAAALDDRARNAVASAAALSDDARLSAWLADQLDDGDPRVRRRAAAALAHPWHAAHVSALAAAAEKDPDKRVARAAVNALAAIGGDAARSALTRVANERRDDVANTARRVLRAAPTPLSPAG